MIYTRLTPKEFPIGLLYILLIMHIGVCSDLGQPLKMVMSLGGTGWDMQCDLN